MMNISVKHGCVQGAMMAWTGVHIGRSIIAATSPLGRPAEDAGRQGAQIGKGLSANALKK